MALWKMPPNHVLEDHVDLDDGDVALAKALFETRLEGVVQRRDEMSKRELCDGERSRARGRRLCCATEKREREERVWEGGGRHE